MRSLSVSIVTPRMRSRFRRSIALGRRAAPVDAVERGERSQAADWLGADAPRLRTLFDGPSGDEIVQELAEILRRQVLVVVIVDLHHRRVAAGAEAFDLDP